MTVIEGEALAIVEHGTALYYPADTLRTHSIALRAIPYYAWDNRTPGRMVVWVPCS